MNHSTMLSNGKLANKGSRSVLRSMLPNGLEFRPKRLIVLLLLVIAVLIPDVFGDVSRRALKDAFTGVSVFVFVTLLAFYGAERIFNWNFGQAIARAGWKQVPIAALLGMTPGCGGAIMVVSAFAAGRISFGAFVATLTSTMGDAAFLLIAEKPLAAAIILPVSMVTGIATGWITDAAMGKRIFAKPKHTGTPNTNNTVLKSNVVIPNVSAPDAKGKMRRRDWLYVALFFPGFFMGVAGITNITIDNSFLNGLALTGALVGIGIWAISGMGATSSSDDHPVTRATEETAFVTIWVIFAYLVFEYFNAFTGINLQDAFSAATPFLPLIAAGIGFVPGCGPQIITTTLYINGIIPFGALMANAISNDGDALFPALAIAPRAAFWATLVTFIPALVLGYGFLILAPALNP